MATNGREIETSMIKKKGLCLRSILMRLKAKNADGHKSLSLTDWQAFHLSKRNTEIITLSTNTETATQINIYSFFYLGSTDSPIYYEALHRWIHVRWKTNLWLSYLWWKASTSCDVPWWKQWLGKLKLSLFYYKLNTSCSQLISID